MIAFFSLWNSYSIQLKLTGCHSIFQRIHIRRQTHMRTLVLFIRIFVIFKIRIDEEITFGEKSHFFYVLQIHVDFINDTKREYQK